MLASLTIKNFIIIAQTQISFQAGLNALVGETGAGKSVLISALSAVCGFKIPTNPYKDPNSKVFIEAVFTVSSKLKERCEKIADFLDEDQILILSLSISPKGTVTRRINGQTVTNTTLKEISPYLVDIHSQRDTNSLYNPNNQLEALDDFGDENHKAILGEYRNNYQRWQDCQKKIAAIKNNLATEDLEYLDFKISEIENAQLHPGEIEEIEARLDELASKEKIHHALAILDQASNPFLEASQSLSSALAEFKGTGGATEDTANKALAELSDLAKDLEDLALANEDDDDPGLLDRLNDRLFNLEKLRKRYGRSTADILKAKDDLESKRADYDAAMNSLDALNKEVSSLQKKALDSARKLSESRFRIARLLEQSISANMFELGLPKSAFKVLLTPVEKLGENGLDHAEFTVDLNGKKEYVPLRKAASGGESSRIMLSLKCCLVKSNPVDLVVFDEIDTGISGNIAFQTGKKLFRLSRSIQTLCITHLPQVCCFADIAFLVTKEKGDDGIATARVKTLADQDITEGISLLLSGDVVNKTAREASLDLYKQAQKAKESAA